MKINKQRIIPLMGNAYFIPIRGAITESRNPPFKITSGIIDSQIKIDFLIILCHLLTTDDTDSCCLLRVQALFRRYIQVRRLPQRLVQAL